ncbi:MAG: magnesium and cobalt transport protein CorA [Angustibacter sp.]
MGVTTSSGTMGRVIVDQAVYRDGRRIPCTDLAAEFAQLSQLSDGFLWIGLTDPTDGELRLVQRELGLHKLAVEDAVTGGQRPKLEVYDGSLFVVLRPLRYEPATSQVETGELMVFIGERFALTVQRGEAGDLDDIRGRVASPQAHSEPHPAAEMTHLAHGPAGVLYAVMDAVVDAYTEIDAALGSELERVEESVFAGTVAATAQTEDASPDQAGQGNAAHRKPEPGTLPELAAAGRSSEVGISGRRREARDARQIYLLKREVLEMRRAVVPLVDDARRLAHGDVPFVPTQSRVFFRDVYDHLMQVTDHIETYDRLLSDILSAHLTRVSVQQNDDMRRISAWVAIAAVPTMIAGIYGMNFEHMPELRWRLGYPLALLLMLSACAGLYRAFKRAGWL